MNIMIKKALSSLTNTPTTRASFYSLHRFLCSDTASSIHVKSSLLHPRVVLYDCACYFCHQGVKWVIKADTDRMIKFCCIQSDAAGPYLKVCGLDAEDVIHRLLFVEGLDEYSQGSTAALRVLSYLPPPYSALSSLSVIPTPIRDVFYDYLAKYRYEWFGNTQNLLVLKEKELLERFIDREELLSRCKE